MHGSIAQHWDRIGRECRAPCATSRWLVAMRPDGSYVRRSPRLTLRVYVDGMSVDPILAKLAALLRQSPMATDTDLAQALGLSAATITLLRRSDMLRTIPHA